MRASLHNFVPYITAISSCEEGMPTRRSPAPMWVYCGNIRPPDMAEWPDWMVHDYCMGIDVWSRDLDDPDEPACQKVTCETQCQTEPWEPIAGIGPTGAASRTSRASPETRYVPAHTSSSRH